jgi:hypothetical protein
MDDHNIYDKKSEAGKGNISHAPGIYLSPACSLSRRRIVSRISASSSV